LRLEVETLQYNKPTDARYYLPDYIVEWSDPVTLSDGSSFAGTALFRFFSKADNVVEGVDRERWTIQAFETNSTMVRFTNVKINEPLDASLFTIKPPPDTHVLDQVAREMYITGPAGEHLRKMALQMRDELPPPGRSVPTWAWYVIAGVAVAVGALGVVICRRRSARLGGRAS
jgi:hypothetical protein